MNKKNKQDKIAQKKSLNKNRVLNSRKKNEFKNPSEINKTGPNSGLEDLKNYVKLEMNKLRIIKPPTIYNLLKKKLKYKI